MAGNRHEVRLSRDHVFRTLGSRATISVEQTPLALSALNSIRSRRGCGDEAELLEHQELVEHQVERDVLAIAEAEHLDVVQPDGAAGWGDVLTLG
jgi:hypothetical protein